MESKLNLLFITVSSIIGSVTLAQGSQVNQAANLQPSKEASVVPTASTPKELLPFLNPFDYDPRGRRDPFVPPAVDRPLSQGVVRGPFLPLQRFDLEKLKLTGIIWDVVHPKAMITDPEGKVYIVGPNTKVGKNNGYIAVIREGEVVVVETSEEDGRLSSSSKVLKLSN